jgi:hypothetical protein
MGLTEVYEKLAAADAVIQEQEQEVMDKLGEEDAAGRIMARGFADELSKLGEFGGQPSFGGPAGDTIKSKPYQTGGTDKKTQGAMGEGEVVFGKRRKFGGPAGAFKTEGALASHMQKTQRKQRKPSAAGPTARAPSPMMAAGPGGLGRKPVPQG